jgi:predicted transcriptional regulator
MATTTIELSPKLKRQLEELARRTGRAESDVVREALETYVKAHAPAQVRRRPMAKSMGMIEDPELNAVDVDDWLRANWQPE